MCEVTRAEDGNAFLSSPNRHVFQVGIAGSGSREPGMNVQIVMEHRVSFTQSGCASTVEIIPNKDEATLDRSSRSA